MKIADLRSRVLEAALNFAGNDIDRELVALVVNLTVPMVGLSVTPDGEMYNPAPDPKFMPPGMEAKWGGGARPRRRGSRR